MVKIDPTIYLKPSHQDDEVIIFGKSPELEEKDLKDGVSRIGGMGRVPNYTKAYLRAARLLIKEASEKNDLDQLGLPIFYLHRHSLELFIKNLLDMLYDIASMRYELNPTSQTKEHLPSKAQLKRLTSEHELAPLHNDLTSVSTLLGFGRPPESIEAMVKMIATYETEPTWSRYLKPRHKNSKVYLENEVVIPSLEMHAALERAVKEIGFDFEASPETFETSLYFEWNSLTTRLDHENG